MIQGEKELEITTKKEDVLDLEDLQEQMEAELGKAKKKKGDVKLN